MESFFLLEPSVDIRAMQRFVDGFKNNVDSRDNVLIPELHHPKAVRSQKGIALRIIVRLLDVLGTIQLDDEACFDAREIADVGSD